MLSSVDNDQIQKYLGELAAFETQYSSLCQQSNEKFGNIIDVTMGYQSNMASLNKDMLNLQIQKKNIDNCCKRLSNIQLYRRCPYELEAILAPGPTGDIETYLKALEKLAEAHRFFSSYNSDDQEIRRIVSLYSRGLDKLDENFDALLKNTFNGINIDCLYSIVTDKNRDTTDLALDSLEQVNDRSLTHIDCIAEWMNKAQPESELDNIRGGVGGPNTLPIPTQPSSRYSAFRRDLVRSALGRFRVCLKQKEIQPASTRGSVTSQTQIKVKPKRAPGFMWADGLNCDQYALSFAALIRLHQNERQWLQRLQIVPGFDRLPISMDSIVKIPTNELLSEGYNMIDFVDRSIERDDFNNMLALLPVLEVISKLGYQLLDVLRNVDHVLTPINNFTHKLIRKSLQSMESFVASLSRSSFEQSGGGGGGRVHVPQDATVHQLTTNVLLHLDNLLEFSNLLPVILTAQTLHVSGTDNCIAFLHKATSSESIYDLQIIGQYLDNETRLDTLLPPPSPPASAVSALSSGIVRLSDSYQDPIIRLVFQLNNTHYLLKASNSSEIGKLIRSHDQQCINQLADNLDMIKQYYIDQCMQGFPMLTSSALNRVQQLSSSRLDMKDRGALKSMWSDFNSALTSLIKLHSSISIPDRDLREALQQKLASALAPKYASFYQLSQAVTFSRHREKYLLSTPAGVEQQLLNLVRC